MGISELRSKQFNAIETSMLELTLHEFFRKLQKADKGYNDQASKAEPQESRVMRLLF